MCKAVLESGADEKVAESLNIGIVYLMAIPYILVALIGVLIYFKFLKNLIFFFKFATWYCKVPCIIK